jgi:hypothetical protein
MANFTEVLRELQEERSRLDKAIQAIAELVGLDRTGVSQTKARGATRTVSAAARRKMAAAHSVVPQLKPL